MDTFNASELKRLTAPQQGPCITIYMSTHTAGRDGQQDALRLKNLVGQAERELTSQGVRAPEAKKLLAPVRRLPKEPGFWDKRSDGLAIFVSQETFDRYRVPLELDQTVIVHRRFQVKSLLPLLDSNDHYFVLAFSQNRVRFFEGKRFSMQELTIDGMPENMEQALNLDGADRGSQVHSAMRGSLGKQAAVFHGQGGEREAAKDDLAQYFRVIDAALRDTLRDQRVPLFLAAVQYLLPIYREVSSYAHIAQEDLPGNPDHLSDRELHARVGPLVESYAQNAREEAAAKYHQLAGTGKTSDDIRQIVPAAHQGQVDTLFVDRSDHQWGSFDPSTGKVELRLPRQAADDDLLDYAAVQTLRHRGAVYAVSPDQSPSPPAAAVFRYHTAPGQV